MKIDYAIHSIDDNPLYSEFWEPVSKIWKNKFKVEPVLIVIKKNNYRFLINNLKIVIK